MPARDRETLDVKTRQQWRTWLHEHHGTVPEIWLVFHKQHTGKKSIGYQDALEEALCYGWIDSLIKRLDDDRYARKFTPRKADSKWSTVNRRLYAKLKKEGRLAAPGRKRPPTTRSGDAPHHGLSAIPPDIVKRIKAHAEAWGHFEKLAPSYQRIYAGWILSAKREETREKRLGEAVRLLAEGKKLGLK